MEIIEKLDAADAQWVRQNEAMVTGHVDMGTDQLTGFGFVAISGKRQLLANVTPRSDAVALSSLINKFIINDARATQCYFVRGAGEMHWVEGANDVLMKAWDLSGLKVPAVMDDAAYESPCQHLVVDKHGFVKVLYTFTPSEGIIGLPAPQVIGFVPEHGAAAGIRAYRTIQPGPR